MNQNDVRVNVRVRNNLILTRMDQAGIKSVAELCRQINEEMSTTGKNISQMTLGRIINMKEAALLPDGTWSNVANVLSTFFKCLPSNLFSEMQQRIVLRRNQSEAEMSFSQIQQLIVQHPSNPEVALQASEFATNLRVAISSLTSREAEVIRMRFGIDCTEMTLEEIAKIFKTTRERIRQKEARALRKLKHPSRLKQIAAASCSVTTVTEKLYDQTYTFKVHTIDENIMDALREN